MTGDGWHAKPALADSAEFIDLFLSAGTVNSWQAWGFLAVFSICVLLIAAFSPPQAAGL